MASFLPGVTDAPVQQHLYQPDYNFLASVMGQKQQQYDQGFAKVKNLYSSLLNSPLSNQENMQYREDVFRKLETQIRSVSGADLSQSSNVAKAKGLFTPLTDDKDLQADMVQTQRVGIELAKADSYMNSPDPELRRKYSDIARQDLVNVQRQLSEAKRGDGSLQKVQGQQFTPFEDVNEFLDKRAKDQGFKVVHDTQKGFYLVKTTNGPGEVPLFSAWAKQAMGSQFDRQFQTQTRVGVENGIRGLMQQTPGLTREQAQQSLAQTYAQTAIADMDARITRNNHDLDVVTTQLGHFKNKSAIPASQQAYYNQLITQRDQLTQESKNYEQNKADYQNPEKLNILTATLPSILTEELKSHTASRWATTHAMLTREEEIRPDTAALTQFTTQHEDSRFYSKLNQDAKFKQIDVAMANREFQLKSSRDGFDRVLEQAKFQQGQHEFDSQQQVREGQLAVNEYAAGIKGYSAMMKGSGASKNGKPTPGIEITGAYTPAQTTTAVDVLHEQRAALFNDIYQSTFALTNSPLEVFYPDGTARGDIQRIASKLMDLREGNKVNFTPHEKQAFADFAKRFHLPATLSQNPLHAHELLQVMSAQMAKQLPVALKTRSEAGDPHSMELLHNVNKSVGSLLGGAAQEKLIKEQLTKVSSLMTDVQGKLKPEYEGATPIGRDAKGHILYDAATVKDPKAKLALNAAADQATLNMTRLSGTSYQVNLPEEQLITSLSKSNQILSVREGVNGQLTDVTEAYTAGKNTQASALLNLPASAVQAAIGKTMEMRVDPARNTTTFVMRVDPKAGYSTPKTGVLRDVHTVEIEVKNDVLRKLQVPARYQNALDNNTPNYGSQGRIIGLDKGQGGKAPDYLRAAGFDFDVSEINAGGGKRQTVLHFKMQNPLKGGQKIPDRMVPLPGSLKDRDVAQQAGQVIDEVMQTYFNTSHQMVDKFNRDQPQIPTHTLPQ